MSDSIPDGAFFSESALIDMAARMDPSLKARVIDGSLLVELPDALNTKIEKQSALMSFSWEQLAPPRDRRLGHTETTPKSEAWLAERELFALEWGELQARGFKEGFLEHGECYECGGEQEVTTNTEDEKWVYDD